MYKYYIIIKGIHGKLYEIKYANTVKELSSIVTSYTTRAYQCTVVRRVVLLAGDNLSEERQLAVNLGILDT